MGGCYDDDPVPSRDYNAADGGSPWFRIVDEDGRTLAFIRDDLSETRCADHPPPKNIPTGEGKA